MQRHLIVTSDGSHTVHVPEMNENYHSVHGAIQESDHIFIKAGLGSLDQKEISILEAGFGTGLNALLAALYAEQHDLEISYIAIEKFPLPDDMIKLLNYGSKLGGNAPGIFSKIHSSPWNNDSQITRHFSLKKIQADLLTWNPEGSFDVIFFDAFGPDKQSEMWSENIFRKIADVTRQAGIFVTYSSKGEVKRNLRASGFIVKLLKGPPGKRHIIKAIKN